MGARHSGRESALQMLFQIEASGATAQGAIQLYWRCFEGEPEGREYAEAIVRGVDASLADLDRRIESASTNWRMARMARVDRNLLRLATWELVNQREVPRAVILDEAVELAKSFGSETSAGFVNGVLDQVARAVRGERDLGG